MSKQIIYNPEQEFNGFYERHKVNVIEYYDNLLERSNINKYENSKTCDDIYKRNAQVIKLEKDLKKTSGLYNFLFVFLILITVISAIAGILMIVTYSLHPASEETKVKIILGPMLILVCGLFIWLIVHVRKKQKHKEKIFRDKIAKLRGEIKNLEITAKEQMRPLNELFVWNIAAELFEKTIPVIDMNITHNNKDYLYFLNEYGKNSNLFNLKNTSTLSVQSGNIFGNPFIFARNITMQLKQIRYTGSRTVSVRYTTTDSEGRTVTRTRMETLYASVIAPAPVYSTNIYLAYGNKAAPKLVFTRSPGNGKEYQDPKRLDRKVNKEYKKIKKLEEKSIKAGKRQVFQAIPNPKFEVLFNALDRNNEVEYRLLFTPVAQKAMVDLILNSKYYDYFTFLKRGEMNIIIPHKISTDIFDAPPVFFDSYDNRKSRENFINYNMDYFKTVYYFFAPLIAIPLYQQHKDINYIYEDNNLPNSSLFEQEVLANSYSLNELRGGLINTNVIINPKKAVKKDEFDEIDLVINGYEKIRHIQNVTVRASDGGRHVVAVTWYEYKPCYIERKLYVYENTEERDSQIVRDLFRPYNIKGLLRRRRRFYFSLAKNFTKNYVEGYKKEFKYGSGLLRGATYNGNPYDVVPYNEYSFFNKEENIRKNKTK